MALEDINIFKLYLPQHSLTAEEMDQVAVELRKRGMEHPFCSACGSAIDINMLRKNSYEPVEESMCLPCFHNNNTNLSQEDIDALVLRLAETGYYKD